MKWTPAPEIEKRLKQILAHLDMPHILSDSLFVFRGFGSKSRAYARIWSLPTVWQQALKITPHYVIEVIAERFDRLEKADQDRTIIHELMHIPKTFSGALVSHHNRGRHINHHTVETLYQKFLEAHR